MPAERWQQVENLYHAVLERRPEARAEFLAEACHGDAALRAEVESLLRYANETTGFLEPQAFGATITDLADAPGQLAGKRFGGYEVSVLLGAGGMGEVYRARELRLGRDVALKILAPSLAGSAGDVRRFEEEARSACVLNHPNIVTIFGVGEANGVGYIAMELVEGRTLRQVIGGQMLPVRTALDLAAQLTEALAVAHDRGIVHRDLKPDNIMVTPDGRVKVLDFGIAKRNNAYDATERFTRSSAASQEPLTEDGAILGTVGYMSPEQATGRLALPQSDQFSFGLILYEMISGRRAFERPTRADTLVAIIRDEPPPIPHLGVHDVALKKILDRCLKKDPGARYATTRALATDVRTLRETMIAAERRPGLTRRQAIWLGAGASAAAVAGVVTWRTWPSSRARKLAILPLANPLKDEGTEYLCDGITRTLIDQLSNVSTLSVIAAATAFRFKGDDRDPRAIGQMLGVDAVLTGNLSRQPQLGRAEISVELIDVRTGTRIWHQPYERAEIDMLEVETAIAQEIITDGLGLSASERRQLPPPLTNSPDAFDLFLKARHLSYMQTEAATRSAMPLLEAAIALDPKFAEAIAARANLVTGLVVDGFERPRDGWPEQQRWVERALAVNPELPEALMEKYMPVFFFDWKFDEAERRFQDQLRSRRGMGAHNLLFALVVMRWALRRKNAIDTAHTLALTDPLSPVRTNEADFRLISADDVNGAAALYETIIHDVPNDSRAYYGLSEARRQQRRFEEAIAVRRKAVELETGSPLPADDPLAIVFDNAHGEEGLRTIEHECAKLNLKGLRARIAEGQYASALDFAHSHATLGEFDKALDYLDQAIDEQEAGCVFLNVDVGLIPLRSHTRFAKAVKRVGLP